ncbi:MULTISPECIES: LolA family protein [Thalassospira]|uniref:Cell envelope biogenesis protein LolA n=2 Tax=Thalassospira TaxID=168934 RepID=A0A367WGB2_9PROT|nr:MULTISPECIES: outer membrane lipoprotein carrier protein LolA [Thalassospira]MDG4718625.1 outer membrane lipoprotein carrier protein LolA [Thalassospira sp. FZY0004]RCK39611.1 cell envelope biogenesis protein LolA [Thalassospira profundimaris]
MTFTRNNSKATLHHIGRKSRAMIAASVIATAIGLGAVTSVAFLPQAAHAQSADKISPEMIAKIENYLANITTLKADFVQISSDGGAAEGELFMERPGKMRFEYNPPAQILLVSTGHDFIYFDKEINAPTYFDIDETPAGIILAKDISLTDKVKVVNFQRTAETIRVELVRKSDPGAGSVTLVFAEKPMQLRQWIVTDPTGIETTVTLFNTEEGLTLDPELFKFKRIWPQSGN